MRSQPLNFLREPHFQNEWRAMHLRGLYGSGSAGARCMIGGAG